MPIENILSSIEGAFALGAVAGLIIGVSVPGRKIGCIALLAIPIAMILYISWWQGQHPENLTSTSGLDFVFGPIWPSAGAVVGYFVGLWLRSIFDETA